MMDEPMTDEHMTRAIGPTIPRWQLGEELNRLRNQAGCSKQRIAQRLRCSVSKIEKIEAGDVKTNLAELEAILTEYNLPERNWAPLLDLQRLGATRGWWSRFGRLPAPFTDFLGLETAASAIRNVELSVVPGLFQTEEYAQALAATDRVEPTDESVEREVALRLARQEQILGTDPPEITLLLDEAVLHRQVGGPQVLRRQLLALAGLPRSVHLQVVPFSQGSYPGVNGRFMIFEFPDDLHEPVVYVETQAGNLFLERTEDVQRCTRIHQHLLGAALSRTRSAARIRELARQLD